LTFAGVNDCLNVSNKVKRLLREDRNPVNLLHKVKFLQSGEDYFVAITSKPIIY